MRPRRRKKRKTSGASIWALTLVALALFLPAFGQAPKAFAVVAGTVFRESGFALPGAEVTLSAKSLPEGAKKMRPMKTTSDGRGEFAFRIPPGKALYTVSVRAEGHQTAGKDVAVGGDERVDVYIELKTAAK
jgi:hypothetical protein